MLGTLETSLAASDADAYAASSATLPMHRQLGIFGELVTPAGRVFEPDVPLAATCGAARSRLQSHRHRPVGGAPRDRLQVGVPRPRGRTPRRR